MKILQLCKKFPFPLKDGESIAVTNLGKSLHELGGEVTLLAMNTRKHFFDTDKLPKDFDHYEAIYTVPVDNRIKAGEALGNLFSSDSYHISRFVSAPFREKLIQLLKSQTYDVIQLETLYLAPYIDTIRAHSDAVVAMRAHNVEHEIWQRITDNTRFWPKKWYLQHLSDKLRRYEIAQSAHYDLLLPITHRDLNTFRALGYDGPAEVVPIGIHAEDYRADFSSFRRPMSIGFIGSLDWMPNVEGLQWFLDNVWTKIHKKYPAITLHIAGRNTPESLTKLCLKNVIVHGEVPSAPDFINQHSLMVVPLLSGSGMRAKILEAMALGKVVLTTTLGAEGIHARHKSELIVADHPDAFLHAVDYCARRNGRLESIGRKAQDFVGRHYDSREIGQGLMKAYASFTVEAL